MNTIGIDLGTYNSAAAVVLDNREVVMVESRYGKTPFGKNFPSFVEFDRNGEKQRVGYHAKNDLEVNPELVIWGVKRLVGIAYEKAQNKNELKRFKYNIEKDTDGRILIRVGEKLFTPTDILQFILQEIKEDAENSRVNPMLGNKIEKAVISVPAYFNAIRTNPIIEAAKNAGFLEVETIAEPTAAAIAYCKQGLKIGKQANILAFDMGAGTLDVTVMLIVNENGNLIPGELCTSGNEALGGIDMDDMLTEYIKGKYEIIEPDSKFKQEVEKAKIRLSTKPTVPLDLLVKYQTVDITREELESVLSPLLEKCRGPIRVALQQSGLTASDLDHVLLVGGPLHMPCVRQLVIDELGKLGVKKKVLDELESIEKNGFPIDHMECVARGAALKASGVIMPLSSVLPEGYGTIYGPISGLPDYYIPIIEDNTPYPIDGKGGVRYGDPNLLEIRVRLVTKTVDSDKSKEEKIEYKYENMGFFAIAITPIGELPVIDVLLDIDENKQLNVKLIHTQSGQHVTLLKPSESNGQELQLQEHTPPKFWTEAEVESLKNQARKETTSSISGTETPEEKVTGWTKEHIERHIRAAQEALILAQDQSDPKIIEAVSELKSAIDDAVQNGYKNANEDCPTISNRTKELLNALLIAGYIPENAYRDYMFQMVGISRIKTR